MHFHKKYLHVFTYTFHHRSYIFFYVFPMEKITLHAFCVAQNNSLLEMKSNFYREKDEHNVMHKNMVETKWS